MEVGTVSKAEKDVAVEMAKAVQHMVMQLPEDALKAVYADMQRADSLGPILEPTLYRSHGHTNAYNLRCIKALLAYRDALEIVKDDMEATR